MDKSEIAAEKKPYVYSPATLAKHWLCSERHVRNLIKSGSLRAFRIGKLLRVRISDAEEYETSAAQQSPEPYVEQTESELLKTLMERSRIRAIRLDLKRRNEPKKG